MYITSKTISYEDINKDSIKTGVATWVDNMKTFGGWGIKLGLNGTTAYNAKNGDYVDLTTKKGYTYRLVSNDVQTVASLLRGEGTRSDSDTAGAEPVNEKEVDGPISAVIS